MEEYEKLKKEYMLKKKITTEELNQKQMVELKREYNKKKIVSKEKIDIEEYE